MSTQTEAQAADTAAATKDGKTPNAGRRTPNAESARSSQPLNDSTAQPFPTVLVQQVPLAEFVRSPFNRTVDTKTAEFKELVESIRQYGVIQPGVARPLPGAFTQAKPPSVWAVKNPARLELVIGEHRWLGSMEAKRATMPIIVRQLTDLEVVELQTIENDKRKDLSPIEEAEKYQQLIEQYRKAGGLTKEAAVLKLCEKLSKGKSTVYEALRLLELPVEAKAAVKSGKLPPSHAGLLLQLAQFPDIQKQTTAIVLQPRKGEEKEGEVLAFRATRQLVDAQVAVARNRLRWAATVESDFKRGIKFLDEETCQKVMPHSNDYVDDRSGYVAGDDWCDDYHAEYEKLWGIFKPPKFLVHAPDYSGIKYVYKKADALASIKANGKKPPKQDDGSARAAQAKKAAAVARKETAARRALISAVVKRAAGGNGRWTLDLFKFIVAAMRQRILSDTAREMFNRRGLKREDYKTKSYASPHYNWLDKEIAGIKAAPQAVGLIVDMAIALDLTVWSGGQRGSGERLVDQACRIFGVDKKAVVAEEPHTKVTKAAKGKKAQPATQTPDARKKSKSKSKSKRKSKSKAGRT